jgi:hypothetical protein
MEYNQWNINILKSVILYVKALPWSPFVLEKVIVGQGVKKYYNVLIFM